MNNEVKYFVFAIFILTIIYALVPEWGYSLAVLSLIILLINKADTFKEYME